MMGTTDRRFHTYRRKVEHVHAIQFYGLLSTADILLRAGAKVLMVGAGYDHELRTEAEKDRSTGNTRDDARAFLILFDEQDGSWMKSRVDIGEWVVMDPETKKFECFSEREFQQRFEQANVTQST